jgi:RHS repeat-associated protein
LSSQSRSGPRLAALSIAAATAAFLVLANGAVAFGAPKAHVSRPDPAQVPAVHGVKQLPTHFAKAPKQPASYVPTKTTWPAAGSATLALTEPGSGALRGARVDGRGTPVWARSVRGSTERGYAGPRSLTVKVAGRAATEAAGVPGVLLEVSADQAGPAQVGVNYADFAQAYGGNFGTRLGLVSYPACVLTTPAVAACRVATPLQAANDADASTVSATVAVPAARTMVLAATTAAAAPAANGGPGGTYSATDLSASGTWSGGGSTGDFSYSYPITMPSGPSSLTPSLGLTYSSGATDGQNATTQPQSSWAGEGWSTPESYIEQSFQTCSENPEGSAAPTKTGDRCYDGPIYSLSLNGAGGSLVWDSAKKVFVSETADGSVVKHFCTLPSGATTFTDPTCVAGTSNAAGTKFNDWWQVTDRSGNTFSFGRNHLPGWASGKAATNSVATEPVYSAHSGDPCYSSSGMSASWCTVPYRWGLDYSTDAHGNAMSYYYKQDTNFYGAYNGATMRSYVRSQYLDHIDSGFTDGNAYGTVPDQVTFKTGPRCVSGTCTPLSSTTKANWPDVPYDQVCASGATCTQQSPGFFSTVRLTSVVTSQYSLTTSKQEPIDTYTLTQSIPQTGDGTSPTLWLNQVQRTGSALNSGATGSAAITMPPVTFTQGEQMNSRLDTVSDGLPAFKKYRLQKITTETGSVITVAYGLPNPCSASAKPTAATNTQSCYPVSWTPAGYTAPITDWFNKYAVTQVNQTDPTGGASAQMTSYEYRGGAAWHYDDNELVKAKYRTYGQFRGYGDVLTHLGDGVTDPKTQSETTYYRGMSKNNNTTAVNVTDSQGGLHEDLDQLAGKPLETTEFLGSNVDHSTITSYWVSGALATRARTGLSDLTATWMAPVETFTRQAVTSGGSTTWRYTQTDTTYNANTADTYFGLPTRVYSHTVPVNAAYDRCTSTTYAPANTAKNIVGLEAEEEADSVACGGYTQGAKPSAPGSVNTLSVPAAVSRPDQVVSNTRTFYDDTTFATTFPQTTAPSKGDVTMIRVAADYTGGAFTWQTRSRAKYDSIGRQTDAYDGKGDDTVTTFTANSIGLTTGRTVTNALGQATSETYDVQRGLTLTTKNLNDVGSIQQYDALGRVKAVWVANRAISTPANYLFSYAVANNGPTAVTTQTLNESLGYRSQTLIYDGLFRPRQTQEETPRGGRVITDTFYDTRGWTAAKYTNWWDSANDPGVAVASAPDLHGNVPMQSFYTYNSLGQVVIDTSKNNGVEVSRTVTAYNGDRTTVIPPDGGTVTTTVVDPLGRTVELDSYVNRPALTSPANPFTGVFTVSGGSRSVVTYGYDGHGNQNTTTQGTATGAPKWSDTYNLLGNITAKSDPDAGTSSGLQYDLNGNLIQTTDPLGRTTSFTYDALNRKVGMFASTVAAQQPADAAAGTTGNQLGGWVYDNSNGVTGVTHAVGELTTVNTYLGASTYTSQETDFNIFGDSLGTAVTIPGAEGNLAGTYTVKRTYTPNMGLPLRDLYQSGGGLPVEQVLHTYRSQFDLPDGLAGVAGYTQTTSYDAFSRVNELKIGPSTTRYTTIDNVYDPNTGRLTDRQAYHTEGDVTTAVDQQAYQYDHAGNILRQTSVRNGNSATSETQCYQYDGLDQLVSAWTANDQCATAPTAGNSAMVANGLGASSAYWTTWTIDGLGDRSGQTQHAFTGGPAADTTTSYTYGSTGGTQPHTLTGTSTTGPAAGATSYSYDAGGNMKTRNAAQGNQTFTYDSAGRLTAITGSTGGDSTYQYDADGAMLIQKDPGRTTLYLGDQQFSLNTSNGTVSGARYYNLPGGGQVVRTASTSTAFTYAISDAHGTPSLYLDSTTVTPTWRQYTPYGDSRGGAVVAPDNHGFLNKPMDLTTGLTVVGARQYDPLVGRFVTDDPVLEETDPTQLNGYGYAANNPIVRSDPTGLRTDDQYYGPVGAANIEKNAVAYANSPEVQRIDKTYGGSDDRGSSPKPKHRCSNWFCKHVAKPIASGAKSTWHWAQEHKDAVTFGVGAILGVGCSLFTLGMGALACGVLAGAASSALGAALEGQSWKGVLAQTAIGGVFGAIGAGSGNVGGAFLGKLATNTVKGVRSTGLATFGPVAKSATKAAGKEAWSAFKDLGRRDSLAALLPKNAKDLATLHSALFTRQVCKNQSCWGYVVSNVLKPAAPSAVGAGVIGTFMPSGVDQVRNYQPSLDNGIMGILTGY